MALACPRKATSQEQPGAHSPAPPQPAKADVGKKSNQRETIAKAIDAGPRRPDPSSRPCPCCAAVALIQCNLPKAKAAASAQGGTQGVRARADPRETRLPLLLRL